MKNEDRLKLPKSNNREITKNVSSGAEIPRSEKNFEVHNPTTGEFREGGIKNELKNIEFSDETEELYSIVEKLSNLPKFKLSDSEKQKFLQKIDTFHKPFIPRFVFIPLTLFIVLCLGGATSITFAQKSLPGDILYPVKRLSENAVTAIKPELNHTLIIRRSEEVKTLIKKREDSDTIKKSVEDYNKSVDKETEKPKEIEESIKNLEEAKNQSSTEHKKEIENAIRRTETRTYRNRDTESKTREDTRSETKKETEDTHRDDR